MNAKKIFLFLLVLSLVFISCKEGRTNNEKVEQERDSLLATNQNMSEAIQLIAVTLDSIQVQENMIFTMDAENKGVKDGKHAIIQKLNHFSVILRNRREQIDSLTKVLSGRGVEVQHLKELLSVVNEQLRQKDQEIKNLKSDLETSRKSVAELAVSNAKLKTDIKELQEQTSVQEEALSAQDKIINECYVKVGSSKELLQEGVLEKRGLFKKNKSNFSNIKKESFRAVDIREFKELKISGKKVRILTPSPKGSYELVKSDFGYLLRITNPTVFWSVSNYLIVQAD